MKFRCPGCGITIKRDMRLKVNKAGLTSKGYKSYCDRKHREYFCKEAS